LEINNLQRKQAIIGRHQRKKTVRKRPFEAGTYWWKWSY